MKKLITFLFTLALSLSIVAPALAQTATPTAIRPTNDRREEFQQKLQTIRDEKKKAIVERMDQQISRLNSNRAAIMLRHLGKIEETLNKIEERALKQEQAGKDISTVKTAISKARAAIAAAKGIVDTQTTKAYTFNITTEDKLGTAVSTTRKAFATDLKVVHQAVVDARRAVRDVLVALSKIVDEKLETTTTE